MPQTMVHQRHLRSNRDFHCIQSGATLSSSAITVAARISGLRSSKIEEMKHAIVLLAIFFYYHPNPVSAQAESREYGIVYFRHDLPGSVVYLTQKNVLFGMRYDLYRTICENGDFMTLFLGSGKTPEEAIKDSGIKGRGGLLIGGTGDEAPRIACELAGLRLGLDTKSESGEQAKTR